MKNWSFPWPNPDNEEIRRLEAENARLQAAIDRYKAAIDDGVTILGNHAKMLSQLVMDTPEDQKLTDRLVELTRQSAKALRVALDGGR